MLSRVLSKKGLPFHPFSGSGTAPVVAKNEGFYSYGLDINPVAYFISIVKLHNYKCEELKLIEKEINWFNNTLITESINSFNTYEDMIRYFNKESLQILINIKLYIDQIENKTVKNFFLCALLCIVEDVSNRKRDGNGLKTVVTKIDDVKTSYLIKLKEMYKDIFEESTNHKMIGICELDSATNLEESFKSSEIFNESKERVIIFSPPYPNSFDYFESYKMELVLGDFVDGIKGIKKYRKNAVRSFVGAKEQSSYNEYIDMLTQEILEAIPIKEARTGKRDSRTRRVPNMIQGYFYDMRKVLVQCNKSIKVGNKTYIVVDQSSYLGVIVPTDLLLSYLGEESGFKVNKILECRKARTSVQQQKLFPYLKNGLRESIIELEKVKDIKI